MTRITLPAAFAALLALSPAAQSGGFQAGDLYLYNPAFQGGSSSSGAIVRVEPGSGAISMLVDLQTSTSGGDQLAYDPWRDRLIFFGGLVANHNEVYLADAAGSLQSLGLGVASGPTLGRFAPRGDGLIYFVGFNAPSVISYFDAANQVQTLMDASGAAPYAFPSGTGNIRHMEVHAATGALVAVTSSGFANCGGVSGDANNLYSLELSADGSRVLSETCFQFNVNPGAYSETPVGFGPGPGGDLILHIDDNGGGTLPRMARVNPGAASATAFAWSTTPATSAGCYSQVLGRAVMLDSGADVLRAYAAGESGAGTVIATGASSAGGSGETAAMVEIVPGAASFGLSATPSAISLSAGGTQSWTISFGAAHAGEIHLVVGSLSGWTPATMFSGVAVPLVLDTYSFWTLSHQNTAVLQNTFGVLDGQGGASAAFTLPAAADPNLVGLVAHHAALALTSAAVVVAATNPAPITLLP